MRGTIGRFENPSEQRANVKRVPILKVDDHDHHAAIIRTQTFAGIEPVLTAVRALGNSGPAATGIQNLRVSRIKGKEARTEESSYLDTPTVSAVGGLQHFAVGRGVNRVRIVGVHSER